MYSVNTVQLLGLEVHLQHHSRDAVTSSIVYV